MSDTPVLAIGEWRTNAEMIADAAYLGYVVPPVLDLTYGTGGFWTIHRPLGLVTNDVDPGRGYYHHDARKTPWPDASFATVVFDPPYKLAGTPASGEMDDRFGTTTYVSRGDVQALLSDGIREAARLSGRWVLVKCMDQVNGGKIRWQTDEATRVATGAGLHKVDILMLRRWRPQPPGRSQQHAGRNYSTLLVFAK